MHDKTVIAGPQMRQGYAKEQGKVPDTALYPLEMHRRLHKLHLRTCETGRRYIYSHSGPDRALKRKEGGT